MTEGNNKKDQIFKHKKTTNAPDPITPLNTSTDVAHFSSPKMPEHTDKPLDVSELWLISGSDLIDRGLDAQIIIYPILSSELNVLDPFTFKPYDPQDDHYGYTRSAYIAMTHGSVEEQRDAVNILKFRQSDIEELEKRRPDLFIAITHADQENAKEGTNEIDTQKEKKNFFHLKGEYWKIGYEGETGMLRDLNGIRYIKTLLERPREPVSCRELYQFVSEKTPDNIMSESAAIDEGLNIGFNKQAVSDPEAKQKYLEQYQKLANDLNNVEDNPEGEMVRNEIKKDMDTLMAYLGERPFPDKDTKRFQSNIRKRMKTAYKAIHKAGMKNLAKHLQVHIKPNEAYGLIYTGDLTWNIT